MEYLHKIESNIYEDLFWNLPERKQGTVNIVGGNVQNFHVPVRIAEFITTNYPVEKTNLVLPEALKNKLPPLENLVYLSATESGSFSDGDSLNLALDSADYNLLVGDFSKNSITSKAIASACQSSDKPLIVTRDTVDLFCEEKLERILMNENLTIVGSLAQLQKVFRTVYYPKVLLMSQSLIQITDAIHKFTLSYPVAIVSLHCGKIIVAKSGNVNVIPIENTTYSPLTLWGGELAAKIMIMNLFNPNKFQEATTAALFLR